MPQFVAFLPPFLAKSYILDTIAVKSLHRDSSGLR